MGKHALAGKAEQTGETKALRYGSWRQAEALADKVACSTHDLVDSCLQRLPDGKSRCLRLHLALHYCRRATVKNVY